MSNGHRMRLVLSVVETDTTFERVVVRGAPAWVGRCLFCQAKLVVSLSGEADPSVTVEHVVPRHHGGTDAPENLALACASCNGEKGRRHDHRPKDDPRRLEVQAALVARRRARWPASIPYPEAAAAERAPAPSAGLVVTALHVYPLKSARGLSVSEARVTERGLEHDRRWMVVDPKGSFLTQREHPALALVVPGIAGEELRLEAPDHEGITLPLRPAGGDPRTVRIWSDETEALSAGDAARRWISAVLGVPAEIVHMPEETRRPVDPEYARRGEIVGFADGFPLLVLSEASLGDLNARLDAPVPMDRFRPNLVVGGAAPYAEDAWGRLSVGEVRLRVVKPCARCAMTTIDQATGERGREPLRTLAGYRKQGNLVMFGQNALVEGDEGVVRVGDAVRVMGSA